MARVPVSFEFFPPKTHEQRTQLDRTATRLKAHAPEYVSCTFGAGGSTQEFTAGTIRHLAEQHALPAVPHISCIGSTRDELKAMLQHYRGIGCSKLVALRGDTPSGMGHTGELNFASDLIELIRAEHGDHFRIAVGAYPETHPQAEDALADLRNFKHKVDAGANIAITQYFYNPDAYFRFVDDVAALGVHLPVVPGIMPIASSTQLMRFSDASGAEIPRWIRLRLQSFGDDTASIKAFGLDVVQGLCEQLRAGGAPALHFYTMNQSVATIALCERLGLR